MNVTESHLLLYDLVVTFVSNDDHNLTSPAKCDLNVTYECRVPVFGLPGKLFFIIHITALLCLLVTIVTSLWILTTFCDPVKQRTASVVNRHVYQRNQQKSNMKISVHPPIQPTGTGSDVTQEQEVVLKVTPTHTGTGSRRRARLLRQRTEDNKRRGGLGKFRQSERLVFNMAIADLTQALLHSSDHLYMLITRDHPPQKVCAALGAALQWLTLVQGAVLLFTAVSAACRIVGERRLVTGRGDWRLIVSLYGIPLLMSVVTLCLRMHGPTGAWCNAHAGTSRGRILNQIQGALMPVVFGILLLCYGSIAVKICLSARRTHNIRRHHLRPVKVMGVFLGAFLLQWWPGLILALLSSASLNNKLPLVVAMVMFINLGGLFNALAYTVIRKYI